MNLQTPSLPNQNEQGIYIESDGRPVQFMFISVEDYGETVCPHCGAEGRYIYNWIQDGKYMSAMAGCYKMLTGHISKNDKAEYFRILAEKQAKGKKLNGWDKTVLRMLDFKKEGKYSPDWCDKKIQEALSERAQYLAKGNRH